MDLDHAAVLFPLALGIAAALVTVYPPGGHGRHIWAGVFIIISLVASVATWLAVDSSQQFQKQVLDNVSGGRQLLLHCLVSTSEKQIFCYTNEESPNSTIRCLWHNLKGSRRKRNAKHREHF